MQIEVRDTLGDLGYCAYTPSKHELIRTNSPFLNRLRRALHSDNVHIYRHRQRGSWVLFRWSDRPLGYMTELHIQHLPYDLAPLDIADCVRAWRDAGEEAKRRLKVSRDEEYAQQLAESDENAEQMEMLRHISRTGRGSSVLEGLHRQTGK